MVRPFYVVFAGVNGAGKSTLYRSGLWRSPDMPRSMERVNPDEIVRELGGDWRNPSDQWTAGKAALARVDELLDRRVSFNQETTLSGRLSLKTIERAHGLGYRVHLFYVGVRSADIALDRIAHRVTTGGHDIDPAAVRRRFQSSLKALSHALDLCESVTVFDNTREFASLAQWSNGTLFWWGNPRANGPWLIEAMTDETLWRA